MIANAMLKADIIVGIAEKRSIAHTTARVQATLKGARMYIFLVEVGDEFLRRKLTAENLHELAGLTDRIAGILEDGHQVKVESPARHQHRIIDLRQKVAFPPSFLRGVCHSSRFRLKRPSPLWRVPRKELS